MLAICMLVVAGMALACATGPMVVHPSTDEKLLARVVLDDPDQVPGGQEAILGDVIFSPTGNRVAYTVRLEIPSTAGVPGAFAGSYAVIDGEPGPVLRSLSPPVFSPDGAHVAYTGEEGQRTVLFLDGDIRHPRRVVYPPSFGRGGRWAYVESSRFGDKMSLVLDGKPGPWFKYVWPEGFTPDGRKAIYKAQREGKVFLVMGKERSRLLDKAGSLSFNRSGSNLAYHGCEGTRCFIFVRGEQPREVPRDAERITFSPDLRRVAFQLQGVSGRAWVIERLGDGASADGAGSDRVIGNADAGDVVDVVDVEQGQGQQTIGNDVVDGQAQQAHDDLVPGDAFLFSPDGDSFAYTMLGGGKAWLVRNHERVAQHDEIAAMAFSPDGKILAYAARTGDSWQMVVDGYPYPLFERVGEPVFSPDGRTVAYPAYQGGKVFLVVGDRRHGPFDAIHDPVSFTPDSKRVGFGARLGQELWWKVIPVPGS